MKDVFAAIDRYLSNRRLPEMSEAVVVSAQNGSATIVLNGSHNSVTAYYDRSLNVLPNDRCIVAKTSKMSHWTIVSRFGNPRVGANHQQVQINTPGNLRGIASRTHAIIQWDTQPEAINYEIQYSEGTSTESIFVGFQSGGITAIPFGNLTTLTAKVRAWGPDGYTSAWSAPVSTTKPPETVIDLLTDKGDIITYSDTPSRLPVGDDGQILTADSTAAEGIAWKDAPEELPTLAKGSLVTSDGTDVVSLPVGTNGKVLKANSSETSGLEWADETAPLPLTTKGDILTRTSTENVRLGVGTNGQVLMADSAESTGLKWAAPPGSTPTTTKGDLIVRGASADDRLPVGANGQILEAESGESLGVRWIDRPTPYAAGKTVQKRVRLLDFTASGGETGTLVTLSSISSSYRDLEIEVLGNLTSGSTGASGISLVINSDSTASNYRQAYHHGGTSHNHVLLTQLPIAWYGDRVNAGTQTPSYTKTIIPEYAGSKRKTGLTFTSQTGGGNYVIHGALWWLNTAAITSISFTLPASHFLNAGFKIVVYGVVDEVEALSLATKGDLLTRNSSANVALGVGANNHFLVADSAEATGLKWRGITSSDLTTALNAPPSIGGVTPSAGAFTTLSTLGAFTARDAGQHTFEGTADGSVNLNMVFDTWGSSSVGVRYIGRKARGTKASPAVILAGDELLVLDGRGYNGSAFISNASASMSFLAAENWGVSANGSLIRMAITLNGTTTQAIAADIRTLSGAPAMIINGAGGLPTSTLDVVGSVEIGSGDAYLMGDPTTNGSWRIIRSGDNLLMQRRESGTWTTKQTITP